jgi:ABC-type amino acid transport substrate-binding protein
MQGAWLAGVTLFFISAGGASADGRLDMIKQYGKLRCGVIENVPEMSEEVNGRYVGYDVDFCRDLGKKLSVATDVIPVPDKDRYKALLLEQKLDIVIGHTAAEEAKDQYVEISIPYFAFGDDDVRLIVTPKGDRQFAKFINEFIWGQIVSGRQAKLHNDYTGEPPPNLKDRTCGYKACPWLDR